MSFYLRPAFVTADGDIVEPSVHYFGHEDSLKNIQGLLLHHVSIADQTGAAVPLAEIWGGFLMPIDAEIKSISIAAPAIITTKVPHGLNNGDKIFLAGTTYGGCDVGDGYGVVAGAAAYSFNVGRAATVAGTKGTIHNSESVIKLTNFGATMVGGTEGVGPYVGLYVDTNANNRVNILYHEM